MDNAPATPDDRSLDSVTIRLRARAARQAEVAGAIRAIRTGTGPAASEPTLTGHVQPYQLLVSPLEGPRRRTKRNYDYFQQLDASVSSLLSEGPSALTPGGGS